MPPFVGCCYRRCRTSWFSRGNKLAEHGLSVLVVESGSLQPTEISKSLNEVDNVCEEYAGATAGRARVLEAPQLSGVGQCCRLVRKVPR